MQLWHLVYKTHNLFRDLFSFPSSCLDVRSLFSISSFTAFIACQAATWISLCHRAPRYPFLCLLSCDITPLFCGIQRSRTLPKWIERVKLAKFILVIVVKRRVVQFVRSRIRTSTTSKRALTCQNHASNLLPRRNLDMRNDSFPRFLNS